MFKLNRVNSIYCKVDEESKNWCNHFHGVYMSKEISKPKSRKEYDQMKRDKLNTQNSVSDNESIIKKCKKLFKRSSLES
jgi:hypothetical protein